VPLRDHEAVERADREAGRHTERQRRRLGPAPVGERDAHQAAGQRRGGRDRQVDPARDDHDRLADGQDHRDRVLAQDVEQVLLGEEVLGRNREPDHQRDQDDQRAAAPARRSRHPGDARAQGRRLDRRLRHVPLRPRP
jgi:hypothetical protein